MSGKSIHIHGDLNLGNGSIANLGSDLNRVTQSAGQVQQTARGMAPKRPTAKPRNLPCPSLGTLFKGREELLADIRAGFEGKPGPHRAQAQLIVARHAIHGLGSIGKTRAAVEYAWRHVEDYRALLFLTAQSAQDLHTKLAAPEGTEELFEDSEDPREILGRLCGEQDSDPLEALADLRDPSLLQPADEAEYESDGQVHRVLALITRERQTGEARMAALKAALALVDAAAVGNVQDVRSCPIREPLQPHSRVLADFAEPEGLAERTGRLLNELGGASGQQGAACGGRARQAPGLNHITWPIICRNQPARRGRAPDAPRPGHRRGQLRARAS